MDQLQTAAANGRLVAFVGAGVSGIAPTCLPSWWEINQAVLDALVAESAKVSGAEAAAEMADLVRKRQESGRFPPELQAELIASRLSGDKYFRVLQCLDGDVPNAVHLGVAALAKAKRLRAVVTTNFDRVLESALRQLDVPFEVAADTDDFEPLATDPASSFADDAPLRVLKLHGSAEDASSLVDTLAQRKQGLPRALRACMRHLLATNHWLFLGYSGADLAADPNYLSLRGMVAAEPPAVGFTWLLRDGDEPHPAVASLVDLYGDRGRITHGNLPGWLDDLVADLDVPAPADRDEEAARAEATKAVHAHTAAWAEEWGPHRCVVMLTELADAAQGGKKVGAFLQRVYDETSDEDRQQEPFAYVCHQLARERMAGGPHWQVGADDGDDDDPVMSLFRTAHDLLEAAGKELQVGQMLSEMGDYLRHRGDLDEAVEHYERAKAIFERVGTDRDRATSLNDLAGVHIDRREHETALQLLNEELAIHEAAGKELDRAQTMMSIAGIHIHRRQYELALKLINDAKEIAERLGNDEAAASAMNQTAAVHYSLGKHSRAQELWEQVATIFRRIGEPLKEAQTRGNIAQVLLKNGKVDEAKATFLDLRETFQRAGSLEGVAMTCGQLAGVHRAEGDVDGAHKLYELCIDTYRQMGADTAAAPWVRDLGVMYRDRKDWDTAAKYQLQALEMYEKGGDHESAGDNARDLAVIAHHQDNNDKAREWAERAVAYYEKAGADDEADEARALAREFGSDIEPPKSSGSGCAAALLLGVSIVLMLLA